MPRKPNVREKNRHWFGEAGGVGRYLGRVDAMSKKDAQALLGLAVKGKVLRSRPKSTAAITVVELIGRYLAWVEAHRSRQLALPGLPAGAWAFFMR